MVCVWPIFRILPATPVGLGIGIGSGVRAMVVVGVGDRVGGKVGDGLRWGGFVDIVAISHHARPATLLHTAEHEQLRFFTSLLR